MGPIARSRRRGRPMIDEARGGGEGLRRGSRVGRKVGDGRRLHREIFGWGPGTGGSPRTARKDAAGWQPWWVGKEW
jgi:hypothetical protein